MGNSELQGWGRLRMSCMETCLRRSQVPTQVRVWVERPHKHLDARVLSAVNYISSLSLVSLRLSFKTQSAGWQHLMNVVLILPNPLATKGRNSWFLGSDSEK